MWSVNSFKDIRYECYERMKLFDDIHYVGIHVLVMSYQRLAFNPKINDFIFQKLSVGTAFNVG